MVPYFIITSCRLFLKDLIKEDQHEDPMATSDCSGSFGLCSCGRHLPSSGVCLVCQQNEQFHVSLQEDHRKENERLKKESLAESQRREEAKVRAERCRLIPEEAESGFRLRFILPDGSVLSRKFEATSRLVGLMAFIGAHKSSKINFSFHWTGQQHDVSSIDTRQNLTLNDVGICAPTVIHIQWQEKEAQNSSSCSKSTVLETYEAYIDLLSSDSENGNDLPHLSDQNSHHERQINESRTLKEVLQTVTGSVTGEQLHLVINRKDVIRSVKFAMRKDDFCFKRPLHVIFAGEEAEDEGGPRREFFRLLMKEVISGGILEGTSGHMTFTYSIPLLMKGSYRFAGQMLQWSVLTVAVPCQFYLEHFTN